MKNNLNKKEELKWFVKVSLLAFILSIIFSFISNNAITILSLLPSLIILVIVIAIGIFFDIIGVAVTVAEEDEFHAKATKKIKGAKTSIYLIRNSSKVSNICADVIGDICGVISGAISASISMKIMQGSNIPFNIQFIISALVASLTIGGKALGKGFAKRNSGKIIDILGKLLSKFNVGEKNIKEKDNENIGDR